MPEQFEATLTMELGNAGDIEEKNDHNVGGSMAEIAAMPAQKAKRKAEKKCASPEPAHAC